jgi:hypothetical protein
MYQKPNLAFKEKAAAAAAAAAADSFQLFPGRMVHGSEIMQFSHLLLLGNALRKCLTTYEPMRLV